MSPKEGEGGINLIMFVNGFDLQYYPLSIEDLQHQLKQAVDEERYEDAHKIKKMIDNSCSGFSTDFLVTD